MNKLVEHIACCIGQSVTGNPTQFVMERLANSARVDLRFFTAEVAAEQLTVAVDGVRAMNFDGLVFLQDVPLSSGVMFETYSESVLRSGLINVAKRVRASWFADNIDAAVLAAVIDDRKIDGPIVVYSDSSLVDLLRLADTKLHHRLVAVTSEASATSPISPPAEALEKSIAHEMESDDQTPMGQATNHVLVDIKRVSRHQLLDQPIDCRLLITDRTLTPLDVSLIRGSVSAETLAIDLTHPSTNLAAMDEVQWLTCIDHQCYRLSAIFEFLTGHRAPPKQIHELLDEFSSW